MKLKLPQAALALICLATANTSFAYVNPPTIFPADPTADQLVSIHIDAGICDVFIGDVDEGNVTQVGNDIRMYLASIHSDDDAQCNLPEFRYRFEIGRLPAGTYNLTVVQHYNEFTTVPDIERTVGELTFVISVGANEAIPALNLTSMMILAAGLFLIAACAALRMGRRRHLAPSLPF